MVDYVVNLTQEKYNSCYMTLMDYCFRDPKINVEVFLDYFKKDKLGIDESKMLFSINEKDIEVFEKCLKCLKLEYVRLEDYRNESFPSDESNEEILVVCDCKIDPIEGEKQTLNEELIRQKDSIKMYVRSREQGCHNTPHVHFDYKGQKNICSISIIDHIILAKSQDISSKLKKEFDILIDTNITRIIECWNNSDAIIGVKQANDGSLGTYKKQINL